MPRTVDEGFRDFLKRLTPSSVETSRARGHRASIEQCLKANLGLKRFFQAGSFGNGTSISGFSDVDYFAEFPSNRLDVKSNISLRQLRDALVTRFPNTGVRVDCPAVVVPFGSNKSESTDVTPADHVRISGRSPIYEIPDCANGWMDTSPDIHNAHVAKQDARFGGKVKPLIRFIKAWKFFRAAPISSFYLEMRVAQYSADETEIAYDFDVERILRELLRKRLPALRDPTGISGLIQPCRTPTQHADALSKLSTAATRAVKAREAASDDEIADAFHWWRQLYGQTFPTFRY